MAFKTLSLSFKNVLNTIWKIGLTVAISCSMRLKEMDLSFSLGNEIREADRVHSAV